MSVTHENDSVLHLFHAEEELLVKRQQRALKILASGVAHEFNNILAGIGGYADIAMGNPEDRALTMRALETTRRAVKQGMEIVRRMMHFSEHNQLQIHAGDAPLFVRDMAYLFQENFASANIRVDFGFEVIPPALFDSSLLGIVFTEIFQNALDALMEVPEDERHILLTATCTHTSVVVCIHDTGKGITPQLIEQAMHPFFTTRGPLATGKRQEAKGLGLSVCQGILAQMNGCLNIAPHAEGGTVVSLCLPLASESALHEKRSILVVDDEATSRRILSAMLQKSGYELYEASNGKEALDFMSKNPVDLIFLDQRMPEMNGLDVLDAMPHLGMRHMPEVIMITAYMDPTLARESLEHGAAACISKPIRRSKIEYLTRLHMEQAAMQCAIETPHTQLSMFTDYVLLAESDSMMREMFELALMRSGFEVKSVSSAEAALAATEQEYYHLILIDSGLEADRQFPAIRRLHLNNPYTPILMLTDEPGAGLQMDAIQAGITRLLMRPNCIQTLLHEIRYQINIFRDNLPGEKES